MKKYYVYQYSDPNTKIPFYIGKGQEYRMNSHTKPSAWRSPHKTVNPYFYGKIKELMEAGNPPIVIKLKEFDEENEALVFEYELINELKTFNSGGPLLNISDQIGGIKGTQKPWSQETKDSYRKLCKSRRKIQTSYDELFQLYVIENKDRVELANHFGISDVYMKKILSEYKIIKPKHLQTAKIIGPRKSNRITLYCQSCNTPMYVVASSKHKKYCSLTCKGLGERGNPKPRRKKAI
jgi:hypothetical protein